MSAERAITPARAAALSLPARELVELAARNAERPLSDATRRAYASDWRRFEAWCAEYGLRPFQADEVTIATHLTSLAEAVNAEGAHLYRYSSIARAYAAIRAQHSAGGYPLPTLIAVRNTLASIARKLGTKPEQKRALERQDLVEAALRMPTMQKAVLLLGWAIGQRRSSITALRVRDVIIDERGATILIERSKTDQTGKGHEIGVARVNGAACPVAAVEAWLGESPRGPDDLLFGISAQVLADIVKEAAVLLGKDPSHYAGHSLRRGFVTSASKAGHNPHTIMQTTGHRSLEQVLSYIEKADAFDGNVGSTLLGEVMPRTKTIEVPKKGLTTIGDALKAKGPRLSKTPVVPTIEVDGQKLVQRRVASPPKYRRDGAPLDMVWAHDQVVRLLAAGKTREIVLKTLAKAGITRGDGAALEAPDVDRIG